jgi:hypothetical protein
MKIIHQNGFPREELLRYRSIIRKNVLDSAQDIIGAMRKIGVDCQLPENRVGFLRLSIRFLYQLPYSGEYGGHLSVSNRKYTDIRFLRDHRVRDQAAMARPHHDNRHRP